jgi:hypothetical protein
MQDYDVVLKILLQKSLQRLIGYRITRWLPTELPKVQNLRLDLLGDTAEGQLIQIEVQSTNDVGIPFRMLEYLVLAIRIHERVPKQILLYVGNKPLQMAPQFEWADGVARFTILDLHDIDGELLIASPEPSDNVLGILGRLQNGRAALRRILEKLSGLPRAEAEFYGQALLVLAGLRGLTKIAQEEKQQMLSMHDLIMENELLRPAYQQGLAEGRQEGLQEGERILLRRLIEQRFGSLPSWAEQRFQALSPEDIIKLADRVLQAATLDQLLN